MFTMKLLVYKVKLAWLNLLQISLNRKYKKIASLERRVILLRWEIDKLSPK